MGRNVHIHVCFACDINDGVAALAAELVPTLEDNSEWRRCRADVERAAIWFLTDLSERRGRNRGPKGGLSLWGMVGNYTNVEMFCEVLRPFWARLLSGMIKGGPLEHEHVIVFEEPEQRDAAVAYEIGWSGSDMLQRTLLITKHADLLFAWMQA